MYYLVSYDNNFTKCYLVDKSYLKKVKHTRNIVEFDSLEKIIKFIYERA